MKYTNKQKREMVRIDYDAIADVYVANCSEFDYYKPFIDKFISSLKGKKVLDVGCGHGLFTNYFSENGLIADGIDFSEKMLTIANKAYPKIRFINKDFCTYKTTDKYDGIFIKNVLFHVPDDDLKKALKNFNAILNKNGKICILMEVPKEPGEQILAEEFDEKLQIYYNYLTPDKVEKMLNDAGFEVDIKQIITENNNATIYAFGLMVFQATKK